MVSGVDRATPSGGQTPALVNPLQTDARTPPGNAGGALVEQDERVIGMNVAYIPPAAPSPTVIDVFHRPD